MRDAPHLTIERSGVTADPPPRFRFYTEADLLELPPPEWLLDSFIPESSLAVLYGPPGCGKSFLALDWAMRVATGDAWLGREVRPGRVLYVTGEGGNGIGQRFRAYRDARAVTQGGRVFVVREPVNLLSALDAQAFLASWETFAADTVGGYKPVLVVFDTLARCIPGGDENSVQDVGRAIASADLIRRALSCCVLLVHHTGKDGVSERGSSALRGAADVMFSLRDADGILTLTTEKQKDAPEAEPVQLKLVPFGGSCIVEPYEATLSGPTLTPNERRALQALNEVALEDGATDTEWRKAAENYHISGGSYYRARKRLLQLGHVHGSNRPKRYSLTGTGLTAVTTNYQQLP